MPPTSPYILWLQGGGRRQKHYVLALQWKQRYQQQRSPPTPIVATLPPIQQPRSPPVITSALPVTSLPVITSALPVTQAPPVRKTAPNQPTAVTKKRGKNKGGSKRSSVTLGEKLQILELIEQTEKEKGKLTRT